MRAALALGLSVAAAAPAAAADVEAGRARAAACAVCHGAAGVSAGPLFPSLAGQRERYLQWQLVFFRSGRRADPVMGPLAAALTDDDVRNLSAYYASLPAGPAPAAPPDPALHERGRQAAARHRCAACHTDGWGGNQAAPAVAGQPRAYTAKALRDYRAGARPSVGPAVMTEAAAGLGDEDILGIAHVLEAPD